MQAVHHGRLTPFCWDAKQPRSLLHLNTDGNNKISWIFWEKSSAVHFFILSQFFVIPGWFQNKTKQNKKILSCRDWAIKWLSDSYSDWFHNLLQLKWEKKKLPSSIHSLLPCITDCGECVPPSFLRIPTVEVQAIVALILRHLTLFYSLNLFGPSRNSRLRLFGVL